MRKRLFFIVNNYDRELPFFETELKMIRESFDVMIISVKKKSPTDDNMSDGVICFDYSMSKSFVYFLGFFFSQICRKEMSVILDQMIPISVKFRRILSSMRDYASARWFAARFRQMVGSDYDNAIIYTFWCDFPIIAFLEDRDHHNNCRYVSRIHGYDLYDERVPSGRQPFKWFINENIDKLVFIAEEGRKYYLNRHCDISRDKAVLYRLGVEPVSTDDRPDYPDQFVLMSCSNLIPLKRVDLIIRALSLYKGDHHIRWVHFGDGEERNALEDLADRLLSSKENVSFRFAGRVSNEMIRAYYRTHGIGCFITTSSTEGAPVSIMEAFSAGVPVIATSVGDTPNMIKGNGVLLATDPSADEVAVALSLIIEKYYNRDIDGEYSVMCDRSLCIFNDLYRADVNARRFIDDILIEGNAE